MKSKTTNCGFFKFQMVLLFGLLSFFWKKRLLSMKFTIWEDIESSQNRLVWRKAGCRGRWMSCLQHGNCNFFLWIFPPYLWFRKRNTTTVVFELSLHLRALIPFVNWLFWEEDRLCCRKRYQWSMEQLFIILFHLFLVMFTPKCSQLTAQ